MPTLHDPVAFSLGPIDIRWYAIFILSGIVGGVILSSWLAKSRGLDPDFVLDIAPWVVVFAIIGARLYWVMLEWDRFSDDPLGAINIRSGGMTIHGAVVGGAIALWVLCRIFRQPFLTWLDILAPALALGQALGRWGNWANQEAFGTPTDVPWAVTIDPAHRPSGYGQYATFHPTFLYESILNLLNAIVLSWLVLRGPRFRWFRTGDVVALYLIVYGVVRFFLERIRTDSLYIGPLPAAYWLSFALIIAGAGLLLWRHLLVPETGDRTAPGTREEGAR